VNEPEQEEEELTGLQKKFSNYTVYVREFRTEKEWVLFIPLVYDSAMFIL
jgi:hypothetical protein